MLGIRVLSSVIGFIIFAAAIIAGVPTSALVVVLLALMGIYELNRAFGRLGYKPMAALMYISVAVIPLIAYDSSNTDFYLVLVYSLVLFASMSVVVLNKDYKIIDASITMLGILYVTGMFSFILRTRLEEHGSIIIWYIFTGAWGTDTFAYFAGRMFGRRKIIPSVSPGKTVEGSIAGVIGAIVFCAIYDAVSGGHIGLWQSAVAGLLAGVVSQLGDWMASAIKRFANLKDFGRIIPGHGGILDRFDSILFTAPVLYYYFVLIAKLTV